MILIFTYILRLIVTLSGFRKIRVRYDFGFDSLYVKTINDSRDHCIGFTYLLSESRRKLATTDEHPSTEQPQQARLKA